MESAFGKQFAKTGALDAKYPQWLLAAFDKRIVADYRVDVSLTVDDANQLIHQAEQFVAEARRYPKAN